MDNLLQAIWADHPYGKMNKGSFDQKNKEI
jgi:hypothetical protein